MLGEIGELTLTSTWKKIRGLIKDDPRYTKFSSSERVSFKQSHSDPSTIDLVRLLFLEMREGIQRVHERQDGHCQSRFP